MKCQILRLKLTSFKLRFKLLFLLTDQVKQSLIIEKATFSLVRPYQIDNVNFN